MQRQGRNSQETIVQTWGRYWFPLRETHNNNFELFCRYWNPHQRGEVNCLLPTSRETPDLSEPKCWWCWSPLMSSPTNQKKVYKLTMPFLNHDYKELHYPLQGRTQNSEGISLLCPPPRPRSFTWRSNKASLFYFIQNSLWDLIESECSHWIWLQGQPRNLSPMQENCFERPGRWLK